MKRFTICKSFRFEAAHQLPCHRGLCRNMHGHSYKLEIYLTGSLIAEPETSSDGMVCDFGRVSNFVKNEVIPVVDHKVLNDVMSVRPTAEHIAEWFGYVLQDSLPHIVGGEVRLVKVRVWETETSWAEVAYE